MKKIMVVDDVATNLKCCNKILKDKYQIDMVKSGIEALSHLHGEKPDLVLLDIHLPDIDGYEVLERIKEDETASGIPVIFVTAETRQEWEDKGRAMGAVGFVRKPFSAETLLTCVQKALGDVG